MKALIVFRKELKESLRDMRTFLSSIAYALAGPLLLVVIVNALAISARGDALAPVALCGQGRAPALVAQLDASGIEFGDDADICLSIPMDFEERLAEGRTARIGILADLSTAGPTVAKLERELSAYASTLGNQRLMARGVALSVAQPIRVDTQNTNEVGRSALFAQLILVILIVSAPFFVSFAMAADLTAGERERRSLEPLLAQPISPLELVLGKFLALSVVCVFGASVTIFGALALLERSALAELGLRLDTSIGAALLVTILLIPFCLLASAAQLTIGLWAKNFKEAQTYMMFLSFLPATLGMVLTGDRLAAASAWPLAWELGALAHPLVSAEAPTGTPFVFIAVIEIALVMALLALSAWRLQSARILTHA
jgi:sodium transport system permease protein